MLLDSGLKLSDIIVILCSELLEADINQFNIFMAVASLNKWELVRTGFLCMSGRQNQG